MQVYAWIITGWTISIAMFLTIFSDNIGKATLLISNGATIPVFMAQCLSVIVLGFPGICAIAIFGNLKLIIKDLKELYTDGKTWYAESTRKK
jgi:hypothetical protein